MDRTVVILQPQFFPWMGVFEQIAQSDIFVFFDHVQLPQGRSFCSRVQIKTPRGPGWLSVPVQRKRGQVIMEVETDDSTKWRETHFAKLKEALAGAPHLSDALEIVGRVYERAGSKLCEINIEGIKELSGYLGLNRVFLRSSDLPTAGAKDDLLLSILSSLNATRYVSGRGGLNYIDHEKFERALIDVHYMVYGCVEYPQSNGPFTPFITALHAVASMGPNASTLVKGKTLPWRDALLELGPELPELEG